MKHSESVDRGWRHLTLFSETPHDVATLDALERVIPEYRVDVDRDHDDPFPHVRRIFPVIKHAGVPA